MGHLLSQRAKTVDRRSVQAWDIRLWPPNSQDLNPVDYKIWDVIQQRVYSMKIQTVDELQQRIIDEWNGNGNGNVSRSGFFQLRQLRSVRQSSTPAATKTLMHAFISSRIDYCNQLLVGVSARLLDKLYSMFRMPLLALSLEPGSLTTSRQCSVSSTGFQSGRSWSLRLSFWYSSAFMVLLRRTWRTTVTAGRTRLRSAHTRQLAVPRTNRSYGDRSFAVSGPSTWNSLPAAVRSSDCTVTTFRTQLKTLLWLSDYVVTVELLPDSA